MIQETLERIAPQRAAAQGLLETTPRCRLLRDDESIERDRFVESHIHGTLFQTSGWSRAVTETFGHREVCFVAERAGRITGLLPMTVVDSRWFGKRLISVPYATGGGVLSDIDNDTEYLVDAAIDWAKEHGCSNIEIRGGAHDHAGFASSDRYVSFERELPTEVDDVLSWLPRKARAAARNARDKFRLTVEWGDELLPIVWKLYAKNMRRLASICYPLRFIENLLRNTPGRHWVSVVKQDDEPVAGLMTFLFRDRVMPYYFGASRNSRRCSAANFAYFKLMERGVAEGFRVFDFGRSRRDNTGSFDFKRFHGFEPRPLRHQVWTAPGAKGANLTPSNGRFRAARSVWPYLPLFLTNSISRRLAPHIPG